MSSDEKKQVVEEFCEYVSPHKGEFYQKYGIDFVMGKREGPYLYDYDGKHRVYNLHVNGGVFNLGHRVPEAVEALKGALDHYDIGNHHLVSKPRAELAKQLADCMPGDIKWTVFGVSGGEAIDLAIKMCRGYTGRKKIITAAGGYHGHTGLAVLTGNKRWLTSFGLETSPDENVRVPFGDIAALEDIIDENTAAVMLETIPATLGMPIPPADYYKRVRELCDEWGVQYICDEVQTGMGRTGKVWGIENYGVTPDIIVVGKGLAGSVYPLSVTCFRPHFAELWKDDPFIHISTFGGSELGCIVTSKILSMTTQPEFLQHVQELADAWKEGLDGLIKKHAGWVVERRQLGLFIGLVYKDKNCGPLMMKIAMEEGLLLVYAGNDPCVSQILPPLNMPISDVADCIERLDRAIVRAKRMLPLLQVRSWAKTSLFGNPVIEKRIERRMLPVEAMKKRAEKEGTEIVLPSPPPSNSNFSWAWNILALAGAVAVGYGLRSNTVLVSQTVKK